MSRSRKTRIYWRERGGERRAYADFRDFADVGGRREALIPPGGSRATDDPVVAEALVGERLKTLQNRRRNKGLGLTARESGSLGEFAQYHLEEKAEEGRVEETWIARAELHLETAVEFFGVERDVASIGPSDIKAYLKHLRRRPSRRGGRISDGTARHYLNSLSNLFGRAVEEERIDANPVAKLKRGSKPSAHREEARWLEVPDAALFLEAARLYEPPNPSHPNPFMYELVATLLLTGGRMSEVFGLEVGDVSFERGTVTFRPNRWRRLKTAGSHRTISLWPQLREILLAYLNGPLGPPPDGLLFPSARGTGMVIDTRKQLDGIAKRGGWAEGEIRSKMFRHTYCSARLQTGQRFIRPDSDEEVWIPTAPFTVAKELGHGGTQLVDRIYGHLGEHPHRSETVEFKVEQHRERLKDRLKLIA
jgi:integrase